MSDLTNSIIQDKEYWISKLGSDFINSKLILTWDDILLILNSTELIYSEDYEDYLLEIFNNGKYYRYNTFKLHNHKYFDCDFEGIVAKLLFDLLPYSKLISFEYGSKLEDSHSTEFKGIPKTLKKLTLPTFKGLDVEKYQDQLSLIELIDLDVCCNYCGENPVCHKTSECCSYEECLHIPFNKSFTHNNLKSDLKCNVYQNLCYDTDNCKYKECHCKFKIF
jgi:hypothetical protein